MDPPDSDSFHGGFEQTLPVLSRPPAAPAWSEVDPTPHTDPETWPSDPVASDLPPAIPAPPPAPQPAPATTLPAQTTTTATSTTTTERNASSKVRKSRKPANAAGGKSTLFWVHTDPESASSGTKEETLKRIRSHVMSEHNRKKRLEKLVPTTTTASYYPSVVAATPWEVEPWSEESWEEDTVDGALSYSAAPTNPSLWTYVGSGAHDPFNTGHTQLTDRMMRHLQNCQFALLFPALPPLLDDRANVDMNDPATNIDQCRTVLWDLTQEAHPLQTRYKPKLQAHWAALIQRDPAILHATICMSTSNAAMQRGELPIRDPNQSRSALVVDTFHHRGETIRLVNEGLSDPVKCSSDELIAAVSTLLTIEIASGNPDYLKIHLAGLRQMIGLRKNFADVPPDVRFQISWTDIRVACMALTKPIFPFVRSIRPAGFSLVPPNDDVALFATRLIPLIKIPGIFSETFTKIIYDLLELSWYAEWIKGNTGYKEFDDEVEDYFNFEVLSVEYSLHIDRYTPTGQIKGDNSIEGCCRLACLGFHNSAIWSFYPMIGPLLPKPILALRAALEATIPSGLFALCRDLLIWLLFIGAACSQMMPPERAYFVSELATAASLHGVTSWQECRAILLGFFYTDRVHLPMLRQIWQEAQLQSDATSA
ncbi:hypothetical protein N7462_010140 [Penicillium macrosclerotiorum]|uniref:uncharacterized protein n=1 Tax=Penicillium macrosclerotiorum TaxID=303699 RepID=UPI002546FFB4|nr:uncharacterized protein N7462_010140 [Penicillium macrosclerotiorum]KAJ5669070.1 hypothetical protein N7462_010140 [Penicillium macrosclerotiorum]